MQNLRKVTRILADNVMPGASSAGTKELFAASLDMAVDLANALKCTKVRNTSKPGNGILFEVEGRKSAGRLSLYATRSDMERGVVVLAISDIALGSRGSDLRDRMRDICRHYQGVIAPINGNYPWPAIGFKSVATGKQIFDATTAFLLNAPVPVPPTPELRADGSALRAILERRGQPEFRQRLLAAYGGRCVVTGCDVTEALEAAHIVPHSSDGTYATTNGLLMRADIHTLFDLHLLTICPDKNTVKLNPCLHSAYGQFEGIQILAPNNQADHPDSMGLERHRTTWQTLLVTVQRLCSGLDRIASEGAL